MRQSLQAPPPRQREPLIKRGVYSVCMVVSWHGNVFRITGPLWEKSIGHDGAIDKAESWCCISDDSNDDWGSHWYSKGSYSMSQEICNCLPLVLLPLLTLCHSSHVIALVIFARVASHVLGELPDYLASSWMNGLNWGISKQNKTQYRQKPRGW